MANETFLDAAGSTKYRKSTGAGSAGDPAVTHAIIDSGAITLTGTNNIATVTTVSTVSTVTAVTTVSTVTNLSQLGGQAIAMGTGVRSAGTQRVTIATDDSVPVTGTFWQATQPVSGTFWQATQPVSNAGTFAVQVDGSALTALQLIDDTILVDDAAFTPGTSKVSMVGFQADETATDSVDEGDAGAARMTLDRKQIVTTQVHTSGGESSLSALSTAAVYTAEVKASAGQIYGVEIFNKGTAAVYARLYNQTGAPGSGDAANIIWRGIVPGSATGAGFVKGWPNGKICSTGIGIRVSGAIADNDTTVLAANEVTINCGFK